MSIELHPDFQNASYDFLAEMGAMEYEVMKKQGILGWIGYGIGKNSAEINVAKDIEQLKKQIGNIDLIATYSGDDEGDSTDYRRKTNVEQICRNLIEDKYYEIGDLSKIKFLKQLEAAYSECVLNGSGFLISLRTIEDQKEWESEELRKELEVSAKELAASAKVPLNSMEFIKFVEDELARVNSNRESWNSTEVRMEEFAAHRYAGSESYFDDLNYENNEFAKVHANLIGIMKWMQNECPLLMAKYEEKKLVANCN